MNFEPRERLAGVIRELTEEAVEAGREVAALLKGLCMDCENRKSCTFPRPASGVWHCEEYC